MNKNTYLFLLLINSLLSCKTKPTKVFIQKNTSFKQGTFGYDLEFLKTKDNIVLIGNGDAQVIVSPYYQGKVFTSTATGMQGRSYGWINYKALSSDSLMPHINVYGGEERFWLAPEGGQYSIFFKNGSKMIYDNWQTPAALDIEPWEKLTVSNTSISMQKKMQLKNYSGFQFDVQLQRQVKILDATDLLTYLGIEVESNIKWVAFETNNVLKNVGTKEWTTKTGTIAIWMLSMLKPIEKGAIVVPYKKGDEKQLGTIATTNYFGEIPSQRLQMKDGVIYLKADGKFRSKIGIAYKRSTPFAGSYDESTNTLTIMQFELPPKEKPYVNQLWEMQQNPFKGDVINAYNDGALDNGSQLGPFYELESSSPAAFLLPGESISHLQRMYHFTGSQEKLNHISKKLLGVSLKQINAAF